MRRGREEVFTDAAFLCVPFRCVMIDRTQWLRRRLHVVRKRYCMMIEYPLQTSLPSKPLEMFTGWQTY